MYILKGNGKARLLINDQHVEQVSQLKYLGSWMSDDGYAAKDIQAETAMGKSLFTDKKMLMWKLHCELKKWIIKNTVWNVALCEAETWT